MFKLSACVQVLLNYAGGAYIYIRREYASRIRIIQRSWKTANKQEYEESLEARKLAKKQL